MATSNAATAMPATKPASCLTLESFAAAGTLNCSRRNGSKKGTTANMQINDQLDNMRKCVEKTPTGPSHPAAAGRAPALPDLAKEDSENTSSPCPRACCTG